MNFSLSTAVLDAFPDIAIAVITVTGADNSGSTDAISQMLREEEAKITSSLDLETFRDHPHLAMYQEIHRSFGSNPNKFPPSIQGLTKRILKGGQLPSINPIVDIYNVLSLRYLVCAGAEDTDKCTGDIRLDFADGSESFRLLGEEHDDPPVEGELVYKDDAGVICRKLNWREGDRTKIEETTRNCVVVFEGFPPFLREDLEKCLSECEGMLREFCGAGTHVSVLTPECPSVAF